AAYTYNSTTRVLNLTSGTLTFAEDLGDLTSPGVTVTADGATSSLVFNSTQQHLAGMTLTGGATAAVSGNSPTRAAGTQKGLGLVLNNGQDVSPAKTTFDSQSVGSTDVLVKYTYYGDSDLNGITNAVDYGNIDFNQGQPGNWSAGDFDYNGLVNGIDYGNIDF